MRTQARDTSAAGHVDEEEDEDVDEDGPLNLNDPDLPEDEDDEDAELSDADDLDAELENQDDLDDDGMGIFRQALHQSAHPAGAATTAGLLEDESAADVDRTGGMSKHERQQARMQERIAKLEAQNMAEKDWFMQGEAAAGQRVPHPVFAFHHFYLFITLRPYL